MNISGKNYFEMFSLTESFQIDAKLLDESYQSLQAQYHPDKVVNEEDSLRVQALQISSILNDAYTTLKSSLKRASYLLTLHGIDPEENNQAHLGGEFLLAQIELREQLESIAKSENLDELELLKQNIEKETQSYLVRFEEYYKLAHYADAKPIYSKLQFFYKLLDEINTIEENLLEY